MDSSGFNSDYSKANMEVLYKDGKVIPTVKKDPGDIPAKEPVRWSTVMFDFTQASTIHGLNHITEDTPFKLRRIIWIVLVIVGATLFAYQVVQSVMIYYSWPVTVNVKVNYNETLQFPAVTICNQNSFRITKSVEHGYYAMLTKAFASHHHEDKADKDKEQTGHHDVADDDEVHKMFERLSMEDVYNRTSHNIEDIVISCLWDGKPCLDGDIVRSNTDHGACITFNGGTKTKIKEVTRIGSNGGLRLRLNIEQYEYMSGPIEGAGIKLLLHDQEEIPMVRYLGAAIPPGAHALVGISILQVRNLKHPYGRCSDDQQLQYYDHYSVSACQLDCRQRYLTKRCHCRDVYMRPDRLGKEDTPICTLNEYLTCLMPTLGSSYQIIMNPPTPAETYEISEEECTCPIPCRQTIYDPAITHATLSQYDQQKILLGNPELRDKLTEKYEAAREIRQRVDSDIATRDHDRLLQFLAAATNMEATLEHLRNMSRAMLRNAKFMISSWEEHFNFHRWGALWFMEYNIKHNFVRGWDIMEERTYRYVTFGYQQFISNLQLMIEQIVQTANTTSARVGAYNDVICWQIKRDLILRRNITAQGLANITKVYNAYKTGHLLSLYKYTKIKRYDHLFTPLCLDNDSIKSRNEEYYNATVDQFLTMIDILTGLMNLSQDVCNGGPFDNISFEQLRSDFLYYSRRINYRLFIYKDRIVDYSLSNTRSKLKTFDRLTSQLRQRTSQMTVDIEDIEETVAKFLDKEWKDILKTKQISDKYLRDKKVKKSELASVFLTDKLASGIQDLKKVIASVRARSRSLMDSTSMLKSDAFAVFHSLMTQNCTNVLYGYLKEDLTSLWDSETDRLVGRDVNVSALQSNATLNSSSQMVYALSQLFHNVPLPEGKFSRKFREMTVTELLAITNANFPTLEEKDANLEIIFTKFRSRFHFDRAIGNADDTFLNSLMELRHELDTYTKAGEIDTEFLKQNIMNVDVFMRELSYEEIEQQKAYELTNLWSDIGGSLGLFIGASVLTVFELIDIIIHTLLRKSRAKK